VRSPVGLPLNLPLPMGACCCCDGGAGTWEEGDGGAKRAAASPSNFLPPYGDCSSARVAVSLSASCAAAPFIGGGSEED
jgi:hypothetical protein